MATLAVKKEQLPKIDLLGWLVRQPLYPKFYFKSFSRSFAAVGALTYFKEGQLPEEGMKIVGAIPFESKDFSSHLFLPHYLIEEIDGQTVLHTYAHYPISLKVDQIGHCQKGALLSETHLPNFENWQKLITHPHEKVVLGRESTFTFSEEIDAYALVKELEKTQGQATYFLYELEKGKSFVGASPETLFKLNKNLIECEALAGTCKIGIDKQESEQLAKKLLNSSKELNEFNYVKAFLEKQLATLANSIQWKGFDGIKKTKNVQHLHNTLTGIKKEKITAWDLLKTLHPTPAIAGTPQQEAKEYILKNEPFKRGFFTGPIGWMERESAEFAVAIRCAKIDKNRVILNAAAGIVKESKSLAEWEEIDQKMKGTLQCLK